MVQIVTNKYVKLDWRKDKLKPFVSRKYRRPGEEEIYHDLRCDICGKWYNYSTKQIVQFIREGRWNFKKNRPQHCGNSLCCDYFEKEMAAAWKMATELAEQRYPGAFTKGKAI